MSQIILKFDIIRKYYTLKIINTDIFCLVKKGSYYLMPFERQRNFICNKRTNICLCFRTQSPANHKQAVCCCSYMQFASKTVTGQMHIFTQLKSLNILQFCFFFDHQSAICCIAKPYSKPLGYTTLTYHGLAVRQNVSAVYSRYM